MNNNAMRLALENIQIFRNFMVNKFCENKLLQTKPYHEPFHSTFYSKVFTKQDFQSMFGHFSKLCMKQLKYLSKKQKNKTSLSMVTNYTVES